MPKNERLNYLEVAMRKNAAVIISILFFSFAFAAEGDFNVEHTYNRDTALFFPMPSDLDLDCRCDEAIRKILSPLKISWVTEDVLLPEPQHSAFSFHVKTTVKAGKKVGAALASLATKDNPFNIVALRGIIHLIAPQLNGKNPMDEVIENFSGEGSIKELYLKAGQCRRIDLSPILPPQFANAVNDETISRKKIDLPGFYTLREILDEIFKGTKMSYAVFATAFEKGGNPAKTAEGFKGFSPTVITTDRDFTITLMPFKIPVTVKITLPDAPTDKKPE
jgi:hypothetical protein